LITTTKVEKRVFEHYVEVSGSVQSRRNVLISAENMGAIQQIPVQEGYQVAKGQLILSMDIELFERTLDRLTTDLALATTMFEKQSNLWEQNIGTECSTWKQKTGKNHLKTKLPM
jgi:membrane fusion protein (multidrug efflux system)